MRTKLQVVSEILGDSYRSRNEHLFHCPFCNHHKKKLSVNFEKNSYKCWVCDSAGRDITRLVKLRGSYEQRQEWNEITGQVEITDFEKLFMENEVIEHEQVLDLPPEFETLTNGGWDKTSRTAIQYLYGRGITDSDILKWKIGFCRSGEFAGRVIIPSFSSKGKVSYYVARSYTGDWMRYKNPPVSRDIIFNELYVDWDRPITIVEGAFDAIKANNAIPLLGSTLHEDTKLFQALIDSRQPVYLALDDDAKRKSNKIVKMLLSYGIDAYLIDTDGYEDVGEMSQDTFNKRQDEARLIPSSNYLLGEMFSF